MKPLNPYIIAIGLVFSICVHAGENKIGATLNEKVELDIAEVPATALSAITAIEPGFEPREAEKEFKHGNNYLDVEGLLNDGREIEFDLLETDDGWQVVEIQRDLSWDQVPQQVAAALLDESPGYHPRRIIESVQHGQDITVYEFYAIDSNGKESRTEVKVEAGSAKVLEQEWMH